MDKNKIYAKIMETKVSRKKFVIILGGLVLLPFLAQDVLAKTYLRKTTGALVDIDSLGTGSTDITQTEVDFGTTPVADATFTITDASVSTSSQLIASLAYETPTGKDLDELEFDNFEIICKPAAGSFDMLIRTTDGSLVADKFKINYLVG